MKFSVYLIESSKFEYFYTGITSDVNKRLEEHNRGKLKTTARKKPYRLIWFKNYDSYQEARKHEKWLKKKNKKYKLHLKEVACLACRRRGELAPPSSGGVK